MLRKRPPSLRPPGSRAAREDVGGDAPADESANPAGADAARSPEDAYQAALALLARRDHCSAELSARLTARGFDVAAVQAALAELLERHYLDDERYARAWISAHAARGQGPLRLRQELLALGLAAPLAEAALQAHASDGGDWLRLAREVRARRFGRAAPRGRAELARQARFLQYRGFSHQLIRQVLGEQTPDESD